MSVELEQTIPCYERTETWFLIKTDSPMSVNSSLERGLVILVIEGKSVMVNADDLKAAIANALNINR